MFTIKTALVALTTTLCITLGFSQSMSEMKKEEVKNRLKTQLMLRAGHPQKRGTDTTFNIENGWNYFELVTVQYPTEILTEVLGEMILESIIEGPSEFDMVATFFSQGWHKSLKGKIVKTTHTKDVTVSPEGEISGGVLNFVDSVNYDKRKIDMHLFDGDTVKGHTLFTPDNYVKEITLYESTEAILQLLCSYEDTAITEFIYRETDLDGGTVIGGIYQERYELHYNDKGQMVKYISYEEELDTDFNILDSEANDSSIYSYDAVGNLTEIIEYHSWLINIPDRRTYTYTEDNRVKTWVDYTWDTLSNSWEHADYDNNIIYSYNSEGLLTQVDESEWTDGTLLPKYRYTYQYDSRGNLIEEVYADNKSGNTIAFDSTQYRFDENNNLIEITSFNGSPILDITTIAYTNGLPTQILEVEGDSAAAFTLKWGAFTPILHKDYIGNNNSLQTQIRQNRLTISGIESKNLSLSLYSAQGKELSIHTTNITGSKTSLSLPTLSQGVYFIKISAGTQSEIRRLYLP